MCHFQQSRWFLEGTPVRNLLRKQEFRSKRPKSEIHWISELIITHFKKSRKSDFFCKLLFYWYIVQENYIEVQGTLWNTFFRVLTFFVIKNVQSGLLTYLWARELISRAEVSRERKSILKQNSSIPPYQLFRAPGRFSQRGRQSTM